MKKTAFFILFLVLAVITVKIKPASVSAFSDGSDVYKVVSVMGVDISWFGYDEDSMVITVYPNGTALFVTDEDGSSVMRYERHGENITFYAEGEEISGTLSNTKLTLLVEGIEIVLEKKYTAGSSSDPNFDNDSEGGSGITSLINDGADQISLTTEPDSTAIPDAVISPVKQKDDNAGINKNTSIDPLYLDFLSYLKSFVRNGEKEPVEPYKSLGCYLYDSFNFNTDNPGYLFWDIDGDGREELLIGDEKYKILRDVYTIADNRIIDVLHGEYKKTIILNNDNTFTVDYLVSAFSSRTEYYIYKNGELHRTADNTRHTPSEIRFFPLMTDSLIPEFHKTEHPMPTEEPITEMPVKNESESYEERWTAPVKTVWSTGNTVRQRGTVLSAEDFGIVLSVKDQTGGWFLFEAPEDGDYVFSVRAPYLSRSSFLMRFYNENNEFASTVFFRSAEVQSYVLEGIKAGQIVYWWDDDNTGRAYTLLDPFELMITIRSNKIEMHGNNSDNLTYFGTYKLKNISGFTPEVAAAVFSTSLEQLPDAITIKLLADGTGSLTLFGKAYFFTYELNGTDLTIRNTDQSSPFEYRGQNRTGNITLDMDGLVVELAMTEPLSAETGMRSDDSPAFVNTMIEPVKKTMPAIGDIITFGHYEQDNNLRNGPEPIEWKILGYGSNSELEIRNDDPVMLLLSTKVLDAMAFNTGGTNSWEDSSLRRWLQNSFYYDAFSNSERRAIETVSHKVKAQDPYPDNDTVFILSLGEIQKYLPYQSDRQFEASSYAISRKVFLGNNGLACWWTRSYLSKGIAYNIWSNGETEHGDNVTANDGGILPAVYLNMDTWMNLP